MADYRLEFDEEFSFENSAQIQNYLNYVFRTDTEQMWTNEKTQKNMVFFFLDNKIKLYPFSAKKYSEVNGTEPVDELVFRKEHVEIVKDELAKYDIHENSTVLDKLRLAQFYFSDECSKITKNHMLVLAEAAGILNQKRDMLIPIVMIILVDEKDVGRIKMLYIQNGMEDTMGIGDIYYTEKDSIYES